MEVVEALHYVPNNSARDLTLSQTDSIGVVVRGADNPFFTAMISAMEQEFEKKQIHHGPFADQGRRR
ncbi:MAG: LacI family DNA-binding transcriptional regulator [Firmicutes bacterium]|nr:LacI family DNA-binding transcriptional regulator [Bacillota bacterium]